MFLIHGLKTFREPLDWMLAFIRKTTDWTHLLVCSELEWSHLLPWGSPGGRGRPPRAPCPGSPCCSPANHPQSIRTLERSLLTSRRTLDDVVVGLLSFTFMIWSPLRRPSCSAALSSWTPAMKMPTSFPPASLMPTLSPFWKCTITVLGLQRSVATECKSFF